MSKLILPVGPRDHMLGPEEASISLVEYGDYQCPYCGAAHPVVKRVLKTMGDKMNFVFRHFPLSEIHPYAVSAAHAAEAAGAQGAFWEMHDLMYENQDSLHEDGLVALAQSLGINMRQWTRDFNSPQVSAKIQQDFMSGIRSGVNGTPTFFINGVRHDGSYAYPVLLAALRQAAAAQAQVARRQPQASLQVQGRGK